MKKKLTEAQRKQRAVYSSQMKSSKSNGKLRGVASALHRVTGLGTTR